MKVQVNLYLPPLLRNPTRTMRRAMAEALEEGVTYWHRKYLWMHFNKTAYNRYQDRSEQIYLHRKPYENPVTGEKTDSVPLHESGRARSQAESTPHTEADKWSGITSTSTKARVKFSVPSYISAVADNTKFKPYDEMTVVNSREIRKIWKVVMAEFEDQMGAMSGHFGGYLRGGGIFMGP